jgi:hypothetical protein
MAGIMDLLTAIASWTCAGLAHPTTMNMGSNVNSVTLNLNP